MFKSPQAVDDGHGVPPIAVSGVNMTYAGRTAPRFMLSAFDFRAERGQVVLIAGANGAGKSTALRIMAGVTLPNSGTVSIFGEAPRSTASRYRLAYMPDQTTLLGKLDARETLRFFAALAGSRGTDLDACVASAVERFGLKPHGDKRVEKFSLGMRRRLGLACVVVRRCDVLVLDEPTTGLDADGLSLLDAVLREESERGATIVLSSHHFDAVIERCHRVVHLVRGSVAFDGSVEELAARERVVNFTVAGLAEGAMKDLTDRVVALGGAVTASRAAARILAGLVRSSSEDPR